MQKNQWNKFRRPFCRVYRGPPCGEGEDVKKRCFHVRCRQSCRSNGLIFWKARGLVNQLQLVSQPLCFKMRFIWLPVMLKFTLPPPSSPADILDGAVLRCVSAWFYVACRRQVDLGFFLQKNHGISLQMASKEAFFHGNLRVPRVPPNANRQLRPYEGSITVTTSPLFRPYGDLPLDFLRSTNSVRCHEEEQSFFFPVQLERYGWFWKYFITPKIRFVVNEKSTRSNPPLK